MLFSVLLEMAPLTKPTLEGVSITHGNPRQHIWSLAAGHGGIKYRCPCDSPTRTFAALPPSFVGDNYFCDGDYNGALWMAKAARVHAVPSTLHHGLWPHCHFLLQTELK